MWKKGLVAVGFALAILGMGLNAGAQVDRTIQNQLKLLSLQKAGITLQSSQDAYERAEKEYKDLNDLLKQDVVTGKEVNTAEASMLESKSRRDLACIALGETYLNFLQDSIQITIENANKLIDVNGNRYVEVALKNSSNLALASQGIPLICPTLKLIKSVSGAKSDKDKKETSCNKVHADICERDISSLMTIEDIRVSIRSGGIVIGVPYELIIDRLPLGGSEKLKFLLSQDADEVTVSILYQDIKDDRSVRLESRSIDDVVRVTSGKFDQSGQLGDWVSYDLKLERLAEEKKEFSMEAFNLPSGFKARFTAGGSEVNLREFDKYNPIQDLIVKVFVPEKYPEDKLNTPIEFFAVITEPAKMAELVKSLQGRPVTEADLLEAKVGYKRLMLTPRGKPDLEISFKKLSYDTTVGEPVSMEMTVSNNGTSDLTNIEFKIDPPLDWEYKAAPENIKSLAAGKEEKVIIEALQPAAAEVGDYEIKVSAQTVYEGTPLETDTKNVRIGVEGKANVGGTSMLVAGLVVAVLLIAVFTIKLSRR